MTLEARRVDVAAIADVPEGTILATQVEGTDIVLVGTPAGVWAYQGICTHEYYPLSEGVLERGGITCALHGSRFDAQTGQVLQGPAGMPLATYPVEVEAGRLILLLPAGPITVNE
jgi:nitrite reductase/ring-hydroxylating ferredoxin subunit